MEKIVAVLNKFHLSSNIATNLPLHATILLKFHYTMFHFWGPNLTVIMFVFFFFLFNFVICRLNRRIIILPYFPFQEPHQKFQPQPLLVRHKPSIQFALFCNLSFYINNLVLLSSLQSVFVH